MDRNDGVTRIAWMLVLVLLLSGCRTLSPEQASTLADSGKATMLGAATYYQEASEVVMMGARENLLREAIETEVGLCRQSNAEQACQRARDAIAEKYRNRRAQARLLQQALRNRKNMALMAADLYVQYGALAKDDFAEQTSTSVDALITSAKSIKQDKASDPGLSSVAGKLAQLYADHQLGEGEELLQNVAIAMQEQFVQEKALWDTQYDSYLEDYGVNTAYLLNKGYASAADLGADVLTDRKFAEGQQKLASAGATFNLLAEYRAEAATEAKRVALTMGDANVTALGELVAAHRQYPQADALARAAAGAAQVSAFVDQIALLREQKKAKSAAKEEVK